MCCRLFSGSNDGKGGKVGLHRMEGCHAMGFEITINDAGLGVVSHEEGRPSSKPLAYSGMSVLVKDDVFISYEIP
jgi:hypothetical protein